MRVCQVYILINVSWVGFHNHLVPFKFNPIFVCTIFTCFRHIYLNVQSRIYSLLLKHIYINTSCISKNKAAKHLNFGQQTYSTCAHKT